MSDLDVLLTALLAEPDDGVAYAAIADILEGEGREDDAHFVRSLHVQRSTVTVRKMTEHPPWITFVPKTQYTIVYDAQYDKRGDYKPNVSGVPNSLGLPSDTFELAVGKMALFTVYVLNYEMGRANTDFEEKTVGSGVNAPFEMVGRRMTEDVERKILGTTT